MKRNPEQEGFVKGVMVNIINEKLDTKRLLSVEFDTFKDEFKCIMMDNSYAYLDYVELVTPDYKGFGEHLLKATEEGIPIDTKYLQKLADKYKTPFIYLN